MKNSLIIEKTKYILPVVKENDKILYDTLVQSFGAMKDELPRIKSFVYTNSSCLPDGTPAHFIYDKENHLLVAIFTAFETESGLSTARLVITGWNTHIKRNIALAFATNRIATYPYDGKTESKVLKLISAKSKTILKKALQLFPDKQKLKDFINSIVTINY